MEEDVPSDIFEKIFAPERSIQAPFRYFIDGNATEPGSLLDNLSIYTSRLNEDGKKIIEHWEAASEDENEYLTFRNFKWKVLAFISIQDVFDLKITSDSKTENLLQFRYFYYESKYILTETILSSLNGLHIASKQLLRNFIEFNLLQNYFFKEVERTDSYSGLNNYFTTGRNPNFNSLLNKALPETDFAKPIKKRIHLEWTSLSERYSHAYGPAGSPKVLGVYLPGSSFETLYFWIHISIVLEMILWVYYTNFPMLFNGVDILKKFGFNRPLGLFVDQSVAGIVKKSITQKDYDLFKEYADTQQVVTDLKDFYNSFPDLSEEEIWKTWGSEKKDNSSIHECYVLQSIKMRLTQEMTSVNVQKHNEEMDEINDEEIKKHLNFSNWKKIYKRL